MVAVRAVSVHAPPGGLGAVPLPPTSASPLLCIRGITAGGYELQSAHDLVPRAPTLSSGRPGRRMDTGQILPTPPRLPRAHGRRPSDRWGASRRGGDGDERERCTAGSVANACSCRHGPSLKHGPSFDVKQLHRETITLCETLPDTSTWALPASSTRTDHIRGSHPADQSRSQAVYTVGRADDSPLLATQDDRLVLPGLPGIPAGWPTTVDDVIR